MNINTRIFGEIDIADNKVLNFVNGIIGFPELKRFALVHEPGQDNATIKWLQSLNEPTFAIPVIDPLLVRPDYVPEVSPAALVPLDSPDDKDLLILTSITVPHDLTQMAVNLMGPFVINTVNNKAAQIILENEEYPVKYPVYDILKKNQENK